MKVQKIDRQISASQLFEKSIYPGPGLYLVQEDDGWYHLVLFAAGNIDKIMLCNSENLPPYEAVLFADDPKPEQEQLIPHGPPQLKDSLDEEFPRYGRFFSFNQVLDLLRAARGNDDRRI